MSPVDNGHLLWGPGTTATKHHTMPAFIQCCKASCPRSLDHRNNEALPLLHLLLESPDAISMANWIYCTTNNRTKPRSGDATQRNRAAAPRRIGWHSYIGAWPEYQHDMVTACHSWIYWISPGQNVEKLWENEGNDGKCQQIMWQTSQRAVHHTPPSTACLPGARRLNPGSGSSWKSCSSALGLPGFQSLMFTMFHHGALLDLVILLIQSLLVTIVYLKLFQAFPIQFEASPQHPAKFPDSHQTVISSAEQNWDEPIGSNWTFPLTSKSSNGWSQVLTSNIIKPCPCQSAAFGLHLAPGVRDRGLSISDCDKWPVNGSWLAARVSQSRTITCSQHLAFAWQLD